MQPSTIPTVSWGFKAAERQSDTQGSSRFRGARQQPAAPMALVLPEGAYVTPVGNPAILFRIANRTREPVPVTAVEANGIKQSDIFEVDPIVLLGIPLQLSRQRAAGNDLQFHLWSNLYNGHFMESWVWLQGSTLTLRTTTTTVTWFGGYTGGVSLGLFDSNGGRILYDPIRFRYGIDGRAFGSGTRENTEVIELPPEVADATAQIVIAHYWDPKVGLVQAAIGWAQFAWELIQAILEQRSNGEPVNGGSEAF